MPKYRIRNTSDYIKKTIEELDARRDQDSREAQFYTPDTPNVTLDFSQVYFKEVSDEKYDVIDPLAGVTY